MHLSDSGAVAASTAVLRLQKGGLRMVIAEAEGMVASDPKRTSKDVRLFRSGRVQPVKRAECLPDGMLHMRVDHGRLEISVTEQ